MRITHPIKRYRKDAFILNFTLTMIVSFPLLAIINFIIDHNTSIWIFPLTFLNSYLSGYYLKISDFHGINLSVFFELAISLFLLNTFIAIESPLLLVSLVLASITVHKMTKVIKIGVVTKVYVAFLLPLLNLFLFNEQMIVQNTFISLFFAELLNDIIRTRMINPHIIQNIDNRFTFSNDENVAVVGGLGGFDGLYAIPFTGVFITFLLVYILNVHVPIVLQNFVK